MVEVVAAEGRIAAGRQHFKHTTAEAQNGDIKGAATEIVNGNHPFLTGVEAVGNRRSGRFVEQAQNVQARQTCSVFGTLTLGIVEVSRNRDHHAVQLAFKRCRRTRRQRFENIGRDANRIE
ncbi:NAD-specific glutamate dehydrogenase [compost metagenome]